MYIYIYIYGRIHIINLLHKACADAPAQQRDALQASDGLRHIPHSLSLRPWVAGAAAVGFLSLKVRLTRTTQCHLQLYPGISLPRIALLLSKTLLSRTPTVALPPQSRPPARVRTVVYAPQPACHSASQLTRSAPRRSISRSWPLAHLHGAAGGAGKHRVGIVQIVKAGRLREFPDTS
jgi:hypothetical protein